MVATIPLSVRDHAESGRDYQRKGARAPTLVKDEQPAETGQVDTLPCALAATPHHRVRPSLLRGDVGRPRVKCVGHTLPLMETTTSSAGTSATVHFSTAPWMSASIKRSH